MTTLDEALLDEAVKRVLTLKFEQGLFEHLYLPEDSKEENYTMEKYPQSLQLARESVVMLKNKNVLPLKTSDQKILVLGPSADDIYRMLGDYTPPVSDENSFTLLKGLEYLAGDRIIKTCSYTALIEEKKKEVQELIDWADVVILAIGGSSSRFGGALFDNNGAAVVQGTQKDISIDSDLVRKNKEAWAMDCGEGMTAVHFLLGDQLDWFLLVRESKKPLVTL
ncbi:MAG: glycoside hydrolase family 3 C-terminal domain-containing protein [Lachnospiraceae bacterium]